MADEAKELYLIVWTPSETVLDQGGVMWVHVKLANDKGVTIWPGHAPLLAETMAETMRYEVQSGAHRIELPSGMLQVRDNTVTIFLDRVIGDPSRDQVAADAKRYERLASELLTTLPPTTE